MHKGMRTFNYSAIKEQKWDSEILGLIAAIYRYAGKQGVFRDADHVIYDMRSKYGL